jgi:hypothetical protein
LLAIAPLQVGCVKHLPPAPTPPPVVPALDASAPIPQGHGRLVVDVVDGPVAVRRVRLDARQITKPTGRTSYELVEAPEVLCATSPCVADVPLGNMLLGFPVLGKDDDLEVELVHVGLEPSVYRRTLSYRSPSRGLYVTGIVATSIGGAALMTGSALLPIGIAKDIDGMTIAGGASLAAGAALLVLGILAMRKHAPTFRTGAANHFPLTPYSSTNQATP